MTVFEKIKEMSIDELAEWLDDICDVSYDDLPWINQFNEKYCKMCEPETKYFSLFDKELECNWCETHDECKFFEGLGDVPDGKYMVKLWLESDGDVKYMDCDRSICYSQDYNGGCETCPCNKR